MPRSQAESVRSLTDEQLLEEETNTEKELLNLRFQAATRQLTNTNGMRQTKRRLAQIKTVRREREIAGPQGTE
ncbi:MAG: 50S ribosomal protein L29 [Dehalococcoidia bacterium]|nr:50S ribosomal protein L29 [Dehalococcoidia bacterium]